MIEPELREEYLWDRSGPPDPLVQRLERVLVRHRHQPPQHSRRWWLLTAAAAVVLLIFGTRWFASERCYAVDGLAGVRHVRAGDAFVVGEGSQAVVEIGSLGEVVFRAGSRVRVVDCGERRHEMFMQEGSLRATIVAAPRVFQVGTPAGMTIDLGCEYELTVDADGSTSLHVLKGRVAFETAGREVVVPARASCLAKRGQPPGTPIQDDASAEFRRALRRIELAGEGELDRDALEIVMDIDRRDDSLSLVHLLEAPSASVRERAYERLARMYPLPEGASRAGILSGDRDMMAAWRNDMAKDWYY